MDVKQFHQPFCIQMLVLLKKLVRYVLARFSCDMSELRATVLHMHFVLGFLLHTEGKANWVLKVAGMAGGPEYIASITGTHQGASR